MPVVSVRTLIILTVLGAAAAALASCDKSDSASDQQALVSKDNPADSAAAERKTTDPCTLLSANEAEVYVGVLGAPPYRATADGGADVSGNVCMYRGTGGRQITLDRIDGKAGAGNLAATTHRVMADIPGGPWDHATWIPGGAMMVTKGDLAVNIDVTGASGKEDDAIAIAKQIVPRFDRPLDYDGAKAVASAPKPRARADNACDVIPKSEVEAATGTLNGGPTQGTDATECDYKGASAQARLS